MEPALVAQWSAEVRALRIAAEAQLRPVEGERRLTHAEITELVGSIRDVVKTLGRADSTSKAHVHRKLGLQLTYAPERRSVFAEATPNMGMLSCPRGNLNQIPMAALLRHELMLQGKG